MKIKNLKHKLIFVSVAGLSIFLIFFVILCSWIGYEVKDQCQEAEREYGGDLPAGPETLETSPEDSNRSRQDCVESLMNLLNDENGGFRARNSAIWALGQLGDSRALQVLESYYIGVIPDREPLDRTLSQYELKKAINLVNGGFNISAFVWRR
jgi:hypothetical protein